MNMSENKIDLNKESTRYNHLTTQQNEKRKVDTKYGMDSNKLQRKHEVDET